jgi:hypothetical protein
VAGPTNHFFCSKDCNKSVEFTSRNEFNLSIFWVIKVKTIIMKYHQIERNLFQKSRQIHGSNGSLKVLPF